MYALQRNVASPPPFNDAELLQAASVHAREWVQCQLCARIILYRLQEATIRGSLSLCKY